MITMSSERTVSNYDIWSRRCVNWAWRRGIESPTALLVQDLVVDSQQLQGSGENPSLGGYVPKFIPLLLICANAILPNYWPVSLSIKSPPCTQYSTYYTFFLGLKKKEYTNRSSAELREIMIL